MVASCSTNFYAVFRRAATALAPPDLMLDEIVAVMRKRPGARGTHLGQDLSPETGYVVLRATVMQDNLSL
jgi:hypothetical protein